MPLRYLLHCLGNGKPIIADTCYYDSRYYRDSPTTTTPSTHVLCVRVCVCVCVRVCVCAVHVYANGF